MFTDKAPWDYSDTRFTELTNIRNEFHIDLDNGMYEKPINSGMISLVFKGYYKRKEECKKIVIKMKRNNIEAKLKEAIENLYFFVNIFNLIPQFKKYQISEIIKKNISIIKDQTNFAKEVKNMVKIKENCKNLKYVVIPEVYQEITDKYPNFIVMEFIEGMKINEIEEKDYTQFSKQIIMIEMEKQLVYTN
jgi:predicted unusual protein kinase regulating ubiquinone biosynthesis (AarF/ABC1/UbiB family)